MNSPPSRSALISSPECQEEGDGGNHLRTITEYSIRDGGYAGEDFVSHKPDIQEDNEIETSWEQPRSLDLSNSRVSGNSLIYFHVISLSVSSFISAKIYGHRGESLVTNGDDITLFEQGEFLVTRAGEVVLRVLENIRSKRSCLHNLN